MSFKRWLARAFPSSLRVKIPRTDEDGGNIWKIDAGYVDVCSGVLQSSGRPIVGWTTYSGYLKTLFLAFQNWQQWTYALCLALQTPEFLPSHENPQVVDRFEVWFILLSCIKHLPAKNIDTTRKELRTDNNPDVINRWGKRIERESPNCLLHAGDHRCDGKQEWVDSDNPHHANCQRPA